MSRMDSRHGQTPFVKFNPRELDMVADTAESVNADQEFHMGPLQRAKPLVHGDRQEQYGHPAEDFARTAGMWKAMFGWDVKPRDVPLAMIAVKLSRLRQSPFYEDSATDVAGYIETYDMTIQRENGRATDK